MSLSDGFALRGAASTGFRAPTPGQQNAFNISTIYDPDLKDLTNNGTIPSTSALAQEYGGKPLEPENAVNLSFGGVFQRGNFSLTTDYFLIDVSQRLTTSRNINLTNDEIQRLVADGHYPARRRAQEVPVLRERLLDQDAGARRGGRLRCRERAGRHHREAQLGTSPTRT